MQKSAFCSTIAMNQIVSDRYGAVQLISVFWESNVEHALVELANLGEIVPNDVEKIFAYVLRGALPNFEEFRKTEFAILQFGRVLQ